VLREQELQEILQLAEVVELTLVAVVVALPTSELQALVAQVLSSFVGHKINTKRLHSCQ
jgi:hypothetical protein